MASRRSSVCDSFAPNVFKKDRCQHCFHSKREHSGGEGSHSDNVSADRQIIKEGYLTKAPNLSSGGVVPKKWKKRWFVLSSSGHLTYSEDHKAKKVLGTIYMSDCTELRDGDAETRHSNTLALNTPDRIYYIQAENKVEIDDWFTVMVPLVSSTTSRNRMSSVVNQSADVSSAQAISETNRLPSSLLRKRTMTIVSEVQLPVKKGWLKKQGGSNKAFKDRWFVMERGKLSYYKDEKASTPQGIIDLFQCTGSKQLASKKSFEFEIETTDRTYVCLADCNLVRSQWLQALNDSIQTIKTALTKDVSAALCDETPARHSVAAELETEVTQELETLTNKCESTVEGQSRSNGRDNSARIISNALPLSEVERRALGSEHEPDCTDMLSVDSEMTAVLEAGVSSLNNQLEQTRAQLQIVEKQLLDEQQMRQSVEQKLVEHDVAAEERLGMFKSQLEQFQIERDGFLASSDRMKQEMHQVKDEQLEQLQKDLNELQRYKAELEGELHELQQEMKKQQQERKRVEAVQLERQKMEEEMQMKHLTFNEEASRAHSAEVNKLTLRIRELEQSLEEAEHSNMVSAEQARQFHRSQLEGLQQSLDRAKESCGRGKEFYESQICNLKKQVECERLQWSVMCESLQQQLASALMQLGESQNSIDRLNTELTSKHSESEALDTNLRSQLAISKGKLRAIQMEVAVATEGREARETIPVQLEYNLSEQEKCTQLLDKESDRDKEQVQDDTRSMIVEGATIGGGEKGGCGDDKRAVKEAESSERDGLNRQLAEKLLNCTQLEEQQEHVNSTVKGMKLEETEMKLSKTDKGRVELLDCHAPLENSTHVTDSLKVQVENLQHKLEMCAKEKTSASEENHSLRELLSDQKVVVDRLQSEVSVLREAAFEETGKLNGKLLAARQLTDEAVTSKNRLEAQLVEMRQSIAAHQTEVEIKLCALHETLSCQQNEISDLVDKNTKLEEQKQELEEKLCLSDQQKNESSREIYGECQLRVDIERIKWDKAMEELRDQLERQKAVVSMMETDLAIKKQTEEAMLVLKEGISERDQMLSDCKLTAETEQRRLEVEKSTLKEQLRQQECSLKETQGELNESRAERLSLKVSLSKFDSELNMTRDEMAEVLDQCNTLTQEKLGLHCRLKALEGKAANLQQLVSSMENERAMFQSSSKSTSAQTSVKSSRPKSLRFIEKSSADSGGISHLNHLSAPELTGNSSVASLSLAANKQQFKPLSSIPRRNSIYSIAPSQTTSVPPPKPPKPTLPYRKRESSVSGVMKWFRIGPGGSH